MTAGGGDDAARLSFLARVVVKEAAHLSRTDDLLFAGGPLPVATVAGLGDDEPLAERVDAFVARSGRLQDTLGDKLLPALLTALDGRCGPLIDNLHRAERLGWVCDAVGWMRARRLRNQMVHDHVEDPAVLADALAEAHAAVPMLVTAATRWVEELRRRGLAARVAERLRDGLPGGSQTFQGFGHCLRTRYCVSIVATSIEISATATMTSAM